MTELAEIQSIPALMREMGELAKAAYRQLALAGAEQKNRALKQAASAIRAQEEVILQANAADMALAQEKGLSPSMLDRLKLDKARIEAMAMGIETVATLRDPVGREIDQWPGPGNGLTIRKVTVPLGVIGVIYESRPNVTADAGALCLKSGNAVILRGGSESFHSSAAIVAALHRGLDAAGLPRGAIQLVPTRSRDAVGEMLKLTDYIDIIVPRGGKSLTERIAAESRIPTIQHLDGNCHSYIHSKADLDKAVKLVVNAKMRRTGVCGATESLVIDRAILSSHLPAIAEALLAKGCALVGDAEAQGAASGIEPASVTDWGTEYLDAKLSIKTVTGLSEAIAHINRYSSHHTDAIVTEDNHAAAQFLREVDSAIVMHNTSTQFADGGEFGMGAEIGISTGRLHARGPVGCDQLVTYKYVVESDGSVRNG